MLRRRLALTLSIALALAPPAAARQMTRPQEDAMGRIWAPSQEGLARRAEGNLSAAERPFATHGPVAGDIAGLSEPALAFAPPREPPSPPEPPRPPPRPTTGS